MNLISIFNLVVQQNFLFLILIRKEHSQSQTSRILNKNYSEIIVHHIEPKVCHRADIISQPQNHVDIGGW